MIGDKLEINPKNVHAYVIGEHGDSEFVPWSNASVGLQNIYDYLSDQTLNQISTEVKDAAYEIIDRKGATYYGIGMCLVRITNAILGDENSIITVSTYNKEHDIFIGMPAIINKEGVKRIINLDLNNNEQQKFNHSIECIKKAIDSLSL